jgi:tagatose 1,6-diphosphate aldolase GatY/KbaY
VIASFADVLAERRAARAAAGAFTCYDAMTAAGVVEAGEELGAPCILLVSEGSLRDAGGRWLLPALLAVAREAVVPVLVQLDHARDEQLIRAALEAGVGAVLADGSELSYAENVAFSRRVARLATAHGASVEAELGRVAGDEDVAVAAAAGALTDPTQAEAFTSAVGAACLAVSIGNVHGEYRAPPVLDWIRLERIRRAVDVPLALHGASGLPDADVRRAVRAGVAKVNVNTEIRARQLAQLTTALPDLADGYRTLALHALLRGAARDVAREKLRLLASGTEEDGP